MSFLGSGRSREGAWIEIPGHHRNARTIQRRSREGAWIEIIKEVKINDLQSVAPARERGLKFGSDTNNYVRMGRSREGAWIEIRRLWKRSRSGAVAPVRERGLKLYIQSQHLPMQSRSREGAWIDIPAQYRWRYRGCWSLP